MRNRHLPSTIIPVLSFGLLYGCSDGDSPLGELDASDSVPAPPTNVAPLESQPCPAIEDIDAMLAMERLDERALLTQCDANHPQMGLRGCWNRPGTSTSCPAGGYRQLEQLTVGGNPEVTYEVTLKVRGITELKSYVGGSRRASSGTTDAWYVGGTPDLTIEPAFNVYQIVVSNPAQVFYLNSAPDPSYQRREVFELDYLATFEVRGGATVQLVNHDPNCISNKNCGAPAAPDTQCSPLSLTGIDDARVTPQPYNGQFVLLELVAAHAY